MQGFGYEATDIAFVKKRALTDVTLYQIDREFMLDHFYVQPKFFHKMTDLISSLNENLMVITNMLNQKPEQKVRMALCIIIQLLSLDQDGNTFEMPSFITQSFIASFCRTKVTTVSETYKLLEKEQLIKITSRKVTILDYEELQNDMNSKALKV